MVDGNAVAFSFRSRAAPVNPICQIGDSRTAQLSWGTVGNGRPFVQMGIGGSTTRAYLTMMRTNFPLVDLGPIGGFIYALGVNDAYFLPGSPEYDNFSNDTTEMITILLGYTSKVALATVTPLEVGFPGMAALTMVPFIEDINAKIRLVAAHFALPVIEYNYAFRIANHTAPVGFTLDGLHYSRVGTHWTKTLADTCVANFF